MQASVRVFGELVLFFAFIAHSWNVCVHRRSKVSRYCNGDDKPWRAPKRKLLKYVYLPTSESWREKERLYMNDSVVIYTSPEQQTNLDGDRVNELWSWPWLWTKTKAERFSWLQKQLDNNMGNMTVQEHIEHDSLFSEFDMPFRWGLLRIKELDVLNVLAMWIVFFIPFSGIVPTDLGIRPDGTLRACPVQFYNCISSSNAVADTDHFAPPLRWSSSKSADQAYEEVRQAYLKYPSRGLKWSSGWIDRGGWHPQRYSGPYFYAQAESLAFRFVDDVELLVDPAHRQVQFRSSGRLGIADFDTQRMRYNQFVRMLAKNGGWEVEPLPRLRYLSTAPWRWTQQGLDAGLRAVKIVSGASSSMLPPAISRVLQEQVNKIATLVRQATQAVSSSSLDIFANIARSTNPGTEEGADDVEPTQVRALTEGAREAQQEILADSSSALSAQGSGSAPSATDLSTDQPQFLAAESSEYSLPVKLDREAFRQRFNVQ